MQGLMRYSGTFSLNGSSGYNTAQIRDLERRAHQKAATKFYETLAQEGPSRSATREHVTERYMPLTRIPAARR